MDTEHCGLSALSFTKEKERRSEGAKERRREGEERKRGRAEWSMDSPILCAALFTAEVNTLSA
jgi:hypothetical protein